MTTSNVLTKFKAGLMIVGTVIILIIALSSCGMQTPEQYLEAQHTAEMNYQHSKSVTDSLAFVAMLEVVQ